MGALREKLLDPSTRTRAVDATCALVEREVAGKRGLSGAAIRTAYGVVGRLKPRIYHDVVDKLLPEFADALEPFHARAQARVGDTGGALSEAFLHVLDEDRDAAAEALLGVTDRRIGDARQPVKGTYERLRGSARAHVLAAVPGVAETLAQFV